MDPLCQFMIRITLYEVNVEASQERVTGFEPVLTPWKGGVLPLHHTRVRLSISRGARIRTGDLTDPNRARYRAAPRPECGFMLLQRMAKVKPQFARSATIKCAENVAIDLSQAPSPTPHSSPNMPSHSSTSSEESCTLISSPGESSSGASPCSFSTNSVDVSHLIL